MFNKKSIHVELYTMYKGVGFTLYHIHVYISIEQSKKKGGKDQESIQSSTKPKFEFMPCVKVLNKKSIFTLYHVRGLFKKFSAGFALVKFIELDSL